jgi:hypothetical protein
MAKRKQKRESVTVPPSPYDFEETVRRVLKAGPPAKRKTEGDKTATEAVRCIRCKRPSRVTYAPKEPVRPVVWVCPYQGCRAVQSAYLRASTVTVERE